MNKDEAFQYIQGSWETRDGGEPKMAIIISATDAIVDGAKSVILWNDMEDVWVIENGARPMHLFPNENNTLNTVTFKNGPFPAFGFIYHRVV